MGSEVPDAGPARALAVALGTAELSRFELVGPAGVLAEGTLDGTRGEIDARVEAAYVYARVVQVDGEMAWSSPIFFG